jgi:hypothetical protein
LENRFGVSLLYMPLGEASPAPDRAQHDDVVGPHRAERTRTWMDRIVPRASPTKGGPIFPSARFSAAAQIIEIRAYRLQLSPYVAAARERGLLLGFRVCTTPNKIPFCSVSESRRTAAAHGMEWLCISLRVRFSSLATKIVFDFS